MQSVRQITFDFSNAAATDSTIAPVQVPTAATQTRQAKRGRKPKDTSIIFKKEPGKRGRKSLKDIASEAELVEIPEDEVLFRKQYYSMSEVAKMFKINLSQIRFWENEFDTLQPKKNKKGDRFFRPEDVKNLQLIHHLLRQRKYTVEGAKDYLKHHGTTADKKFEMIRSLEKIRLFLLELKANL